MVKEEKIDDGFRDRRRLKQTSLPRIFLIKNTLDFNKCKKCSYFGGIGKNDEHFKDFFFCNTRKICNDNLKIKKREWRKREKLTIEQIKERSRKRMEKKIMITYDISLEDYTKITKECVVCGFDEIVHLHHIIPKRDGGMDEISNYIGLCPNHHFLIHRKGNTLEKLKKNEESRL